jgi:hypothetical protein
LVPVCIDFVDMNLHYNLNRLNERGSLFHPIDFAIIPSYTDESCMFYKLCRNVSLRSNMCVIYINNFPNENSPQIFIGGEKIITREIVEPTKENYPKIYLYDMDLIKIREKRLFGENVKISTF